MNLPQNIDKDLRSASFNSNIGDIILGDGVLKNLWTLIASAVDPSGVSAITSLAGLLSNIGDSLIHQREIVFFKELKENHNLLTEDTIKSQEFIHKFLITYKAVIMTNRDEKIRYLARLLKSSTAQKNKIDTDEFEEYLSIITDLSFRELQILSIFDNNYTLYPIPSEPIDDIMTRYKAQWESTFFVRIREEIQNTLHVRSQELDDVLIRISRSGLYKQIDYISGEIGNGTLTPLYYRIKELINIE